MSFGAIKTAASRLGLSLLLLLGLIATCQAEPSPSPASSSSKRAIVFVVDAANWEQMRAPQLPNIARFLQSAAVALMNTKGPEDGDPEGVWVTVGSGRRASTGGQTPKLRLNADGSAVVSNISLFTAANSRAHSQALPGLLGELLGKNDINRSLLSHASQPWAAVIAMDAQGKIPFFEQIPSQIGPDILSSPGRVIIINPADLISLDNLLGELPELNFKKDLIIIFSPSSPDLANHLPALAPIAIKGPGFGTGLLKSPGTRREGLAANVDLAPTLLHYFGIPIPSDISGRPLQTASSPAPLVFLDKFDRQASATYRLRREVTPWFLILAAVILVPLLGLLLFRPVWLLRLGDLPGILLLGLTAIPLATILLSGMMIESSRQYVLSALLLALVLAIGKRGKRRFLNRFGFICLLTAAVIWLDLLTGSHLMRRSIIGYDPIIGERFYGLGNVEAGVFISTLVLFVGSLLATASKSRAKNAGLPAALLIGLAIFCIGASSAGANWGQGISAAALGVSFYILLVPPGKRKKKLFFAPLLILAAAGLFVAMDFLLPLSQQSHLAYSVRMTSENGPTAFLSIALRKLAMAHRLFTYSPLLPLGLVFFALVIYLPLRPPPRLAKVLYNYPAFAAALAACGFGAIAASVMNDSGIVAGISMAVFPLLALIYAAWEGIRAHPGH